MLIGIGLAALGLGWGGTWALILFMRRVQLGQYIRQYGPDIHAHKQGTPTMGGVVFLAALLLAWPLVARSSTASAVLLTTLAFAGVGLLDDLMKFLRRDSLGLKARYKLALQVGLSAGVWALFGTGAHALYVPGVGEVWTLSGVGLLAWTALVFAGATNAFNLTDGLDGLAGGIGLIALAPLGLIAAWRGEGELVAVLVALAGAVLGFLWFNRHPARVFMGDTGSFALGAFVAATAYALGLELYLLLFALVPVVETLSVAVQLSYFRFTRRRIFKVAPLHHHFEAARGVDYAYLLPSADWPEARVTAAFCALAALGALLGLGLYLW